MVHDAGIAALIGAVLPLLISIIIRTGWTQPVQAVAAFVICLIAAALTSFVSDNIDLTDPSFDWVVWFAIIYGSAMTTYARFWKPTTVSPKLESATS